MLGVAVGGEQDYVAQLVQNEAVCDHRCVSDDVRQCSRPSEPHVRRTYSYAFIHLFIYFESGNMAHRQ